MQAVTFILSLARKLLAKESKGITTIPNRMAVEQKAGEIANTLQNAGLPLNRADEFIKSEQDLTRILNMIESTPPVMKEVPSGIKSTKSAKVFDMEGKEIKNPKNIMGGKEVKETEAQIKTRLEKGNKEGIARIRERQKMLDDAIDNQSPSLSGDTRTDAVLVAEDLAERMGLVYDDLPIREQTKLYDQAYQGLSKMRFEARQTPKGAPPKITSKKDADSQESSYDDGPADFDPDADNETFAIGGRVGLFAGSVPKILKLLKDPKKVKQAIDNIFPTGDVKYDATMAAESLVELNPKIFGNKLYDDLDSMTRLDIYDAVISPMMSAQAKALRMKKATRPEKTLQSMKEGKGINMSDPEIAKEFEQFMRQTDPEGVKKLEQTLELDNFDPKGRKKNAQGGIMRLGLKEGSGMTRRTFLKILGGAMSIPIVGKILKPLKLATGVKKVPIIKTDNVPGKPEWFDQLVNKVIIEGDDVTKRFATGERQSIHQKTLDDGSVVRVTEDVDDGAVRVEYESVDNMYEDPVQLQYKKPLPDEGDPRPTAEFTTAESGPVGRAFGPDDYEIEIDEVGGTSISDLTSDVSKLKEYATGKKPTLKEFVESKKRKDRAKAISEGGENEMDEVVRRQGDFVQFDDIYPEQDFASGGIARMLGE